MRAHATSRVGRQANYLVAVAEGGRGGLDYGICLLEASTGVFYMGQFSDDALRTHLETLLIRARPREVVLPKGRLHPTALKLLRRYVPQAAINALEPGDEFWDYSRTLRELKDGGYFAGNPSGEAAEGGGGDDDGGGGDGQETGLPQVLLAAEAAGEELSLSAVGGCVSYLRGLLLDSELVSGRNFRRYADFGDDEGALALDGQTLANLEVLENAGGANEGTLLRFLDRCW